jgi:hypothetical protein
MKALEEIVKLTLESNTGMAFTIEDARKRCAYLEMSPDEILADMKERRATLKSIDYAEFKKESEKKKQENPEYYDYYTGHIDDILIELEEEKENVDSKK